MKIKQRKTIIHTITNIAYASVLVALIALVVVIGISQFNESPAVQFLSVNSGSMEPAIRTGGMILTKKSDMYSVGSVITYQDSNRDVLITHRIIDVLFDESGLYYVTQGDANEGPDQQRVRLSEILGRVIFSVPVIGYLVQYARTQLGFVFVVLIPTLLIVIREVNIISLEILSLLSSTKESPLIIQVIE